MLVDSDGFILIPIDCDRFRSILFDLTALCSDVIDVDRFEGAARGPNPEIRIPRESLERRSRGALRSL